MTTNPNTERPGGDSAVLSERLRRIREYLNFTQQWVSDQTGISRVAISEIERGARKVDSIELKKLARLYRYPVGYFLDEDVDAIPATHAVAGLPRRLNNLRQEDLTQVMKFAQFLEQSYESDAEAKAAGEDEPHRSVPQRRGSAS
ncbi:helix-turn-helix domain-containing protein [Actinoplanes sp. NPDC049668]|uniref:helix-turn-helix domain-containing protein n=1 Tax=unclassified Actinoplanes TaxID=2626549 RepID=UPI0033B466DB